MARTAVRPPTDTQNANAVFDGWFERHSGELRSFSTRLTGDAAIAEDVVQETFTRAWLHIDELSRREEVGPWLYRVARNLCVDTHRARHRVVPSEVAATADNTSARGRYAADYGDGMDVADPARHVERAEDAELVRRALTALSPRHRDVLFLRDIEGMAYDELGRRHGLSGESARAVIARARRRLRDELRTLSNGALGVGAAFRVRVADLFRRAGADRVPVEPMVAAVAQRIAVAAAVASMALGGAAATTRPDGPDELLPPSTPTSERHGGTEASAGLSNRGMATPSASTAPRDPADQVPSPRVVLSAGPNEGLVANPASPSGSGNWIEGTLVSVHPEKAPSAARSVVEPAARAGCATAPDLCPATE